MINLYKPVDRRYLYIDYRTRQDKKGIDYNIFIPYYFNIIHNKELKNKYTIDGWYLLNYLLCNSINQQYIKTNIDIIKKDINLTRNKIIQALKTLEKNKIIKVHTTVNKNLKSKDILNIEIKYKEINQANNGYRAIPLQYINTILKILDPKELAVLTTLIPFYNYIYARSYPHYKTGEIIYDVIENHRTFVSEDKLCMLIGISKNTLRRYIKQLKDKNLIEKVKNPTKFTMDEQGNVKQETNKYNIKLFDRIEYMYNHIVDVEYSKNTNTYKDYVATKKLLKKYSLNELYQTEYNELITDKNYIENRFHFELDEYKSKLLSVS